MQFFALPDSNTPPRVTISVLGHVVVSQMGIVQVPYATVTIKYFRALTSRTHSASLQLGQGFLILAIKASLSDL